MITNCRYSIKGFFTKQIMILRKQPLLNKIQKIYRKEDICFRILNDVFYYPILGNVNKKKYYASFFPLFYDTLTFES